jgi:hypothetical protein
VDGGMAKNLPLKCRICVIRDVPFEPNLYRTDKRVSYRAMPGYFRESQYTAEYLK